ncbi:hypothetical protein JCM8097_009130 [Rhodosporidiobolus ruineniae]
MSGSEGEESPSLGWSLTSLSSAGGGRVDGGFLTEPGSYEDFQYPSQLDYPTFPSMASPGPSGGLASRPYTPLLYHARQSSNPFSPLPSFSPYPAHASPTASSFPSSSSALLPPQPGGAPPTPPPLFDEGETALFSSFLNELDVDPNFLFNPVLPPGMPSPPSASLIEQTVEQAREERQEREQLGHGVGELSLGGAAAAAAGAITGRISIHSPPGSLPSPPSFAPPRPANSHILHFPTQEASLPPIPSHPPPAPAHEAELLSDGEDDDDPAGAAQDDSDPDFELKPAAARGSRRRSRGGGISGAGSGGGRSGKKARTQPREEEEQDGEDVEMAPPPLDDDAEDSVATVTASGRSQRNKRVPRRISSTAASSSRPSLSRPPLSRAAAEPASPPSPSSSRLSASVEPPGSGTSSKAPPLTESEKRSNHIASEQRRRNAIKSGFQDLVDLLVAGSSASGIALGAEEPDTAGGGGGGGGGGKKKGAGKGTGRGRGRKGDVATNASKSVVLTQAASYILWLERGNRALEREVERVEGLMRQAQVADG